MEGTEQNDIAGHILVPQHIKLPEEEKQKLLKTYNIALKQLPRIKASDPALISLDIHSGDIIKIIRKSPITREAVYYRRVIDG